MLNYIITTLNSTGFSINNKKSYAKMVVFALPYCCTRHNIVNGGYGKVLEKSLVSSLNDSILIDFFVYHHNSLYPNKNSSGIVIDLNNPKHNRNKLNSPTLYLI